MCGDVSQWGGLMPGLQVNAGLFLFMRKNQKISLETNLESEILL